MGTADLRGRMKELLDCIAQFKQFDDEKSNRSWHPKSPKLGKCTSVKSDGIDGGSLNHFPFLKISASFCGRVKAILDDLLHQILSMNLQSVLTELPLTGKLLGLLCGIPALLANQSLYQVWIKCVLCFYRHSLSKDQLGAKAKDWAISLLRNTVNSSTFNLPLRSVGMDQRSLLNQYSKQMLSRAERRLSKETILRSGSAFANPHIQNDQLLIDMPIEFVLVLLQEPKLVALAEGLLEHMVAESNNPNILLRDLQNEATHSGNINLSYKIKVLIWMNDLASLERELLTTLQHCLQITPYASENYLRKSHLIEGCFNHQLLYLAVKDILEAALITNQADCRLVELTGIFHKSIRHCYNNHSNSQVVSALYPFTSPLLSPLVNLLQLSPFGLSEASLLSHIKYLGSCLHRTHSTICTSNVDIWKTLICFPDWLSICLVECLNNTRQSVSDALHVILWYKFPSVSTDHAQLNKSFSEVLSMFQGLIRKVTLRIEDVAYVLSANHGLPQLTSLVAQILGIFMLLSKSGMSIAKEILEMVCKTQCADVQLEFVLRAVCLLKVKNNWKELIGESNLKQLQLLLTSLNDQVLKCDQDIPVDAPSFRENQHHLQDWCTDIVSVLL